MLTPKLPSRLLIILHGPMPIFTLGSESVQPTIPLAGSFWSTGRPFIGRVPCKGSAKDVWELSMQKWLARQSWNRARGPRRALKNSNLPPSPLRFRTFTRREMVDHPRRITCLSCRHQPVLAALSTHVERKRQAAPLAPIEPFSYRKLGAHSSVFRLAFS